MTEKEKRNQMFSLVAQWVESVEDQEAFEKRHDINLNTFLYWSSKYREVYRSSEDFIELPDVHGNTGSFFLFGRNIRVFV